MRTKKNVALSVKETFVFSTLFSCFAAALQVARETRDGLHLCLCEVQTETERGRRV